MTQCPANESNLMTKPGWRLTRDRMMDFQELADEAFRDLLKKHNRPTDLKSALRQSAGLGPDIHDSGNERKQAKVKRSN
jgi:hypothetical protein